MPKHQECHKCPYDQKARTVCLNCRKVSQEFNAAEVSRSGVSILSLDALQDNHHEAEYDQAHDTPVITEEDHEEFKLLGQSGQFPKALMRFFESWIRRSPLARDTIAARIAYPEKTNREIAKIIGCTDAHVGNILLSFYKTMKIRMPINQHKNR
jgi:hypothetical protein